MNAQHFEVKKHAVRQTADGWVMSFVVHPADMSSEFAIAPLGTRYMLALAEIGDDEMPVAPRHPPLERKEKADGGTHEAGNLGGALRAPGERAVVRAALLPKDPMFRRWLVETKRAEQDSEEIAVRYIREACGVKSRAELGGDDWARKAFRRLEDAFWLWRNGWNEIPE